MVIVQFVLSNLLLLGTISSGFARVPPAGRKFSSPVIENVISNITLRLRDPDLATMFNNCFPNTLDTTVYSFVPKDASGWPDSFVVTGDIEAMWLRDSTNQVLPYLEFASADPRLHQLLCGVVNRQATYVLHDPFANAFNLNASGQGHQDDERLPPMTPLVFEGKYELDSIAAFLKLSYGIFNWTGDVSGINPTQWLSAAKRVVVTIEVMQAATSEDYANPPYTFNRKTDVATDTLQACLQGRGPAAARCGLSKCMFRPSDDAVFLPFLVPANAMAAVELRHLAIITSSPTLPSSSSSALGAPNPLFAPDLAQRASVLAGQLEEALSLHAQVSLEGGRLVYAYEVDCFGGRVLMDDANIPSLLSLPYLGFVDRADPVYQATRALVLSPQNPFFFQGSAGEGIGGPHVGMFQIWPMSIIMRALTSDSDAEISAALQVLKSTTNGTFFMHESFQQDDPTRFTRPWFAWANSLFGELILTLARERPHLIF